ncbi:hypothetical protein CLOP_g25750 [Closterium sp. NIES-67]|nr:hypothetical protein CLOP_g25750 [Closterium sp. NIES-67]
MSHGGGWYAASVDSLGESLAANDVDGARPPRLRQSTTATADPAGPWQCGRQESGDCGAPRQYLARWTPEEDAALLEHVMAHGTAEWGQLRASGRLPLRDNKACCNRFLLLKRKFLEHEQQPQQPQQEFRFCLRPQQPQPPPRYGEQQGVIGSTHAAPESHLLTCDLRWSAQQCRPHVLPQSGARRAGGKDGWLGGKWKHEGGASWGAMVNPRLQGPDMHGEAAGLQGWNDSKRVKTVEVEDNAVLLQKEWHVVKTQRQQQQRQQQQQQQQHQENHRAHVRSCNEQMVESSTGTFSAPSSCSDAPSPPLATAAHYVPVTPSPPSPLTIPLETLPPLPPLSPLPPLPLLPHFPLSPGNELPAMTAPFPISHSTTADPLPSAPPASPPVAPLPPPSPPAPPLAAAAPSVCVRAGAWEGQQQADLDRWILEQVGLLGAGRGGGVRLSWQEGVGTQW